ncbi:hypothetical protein [Nonlabens spongiae]|nr:hypothetical protein [Nonlabens spongiae]
MKLSNFSCKTLHLFSLACIFMYGFVLLAKYFDLTYNTFILYHLNDLMIVPMVLTLSLNAVWIVKNDRSIRLGWFSILSIFLMYSLIFEYYLPQTMSRYTADWYDVLCYFMGAIIFYFLQKLP